MNTNLYYYDLKGSVTEKTNIMIVMKITDKELKQKVLSRLNETLDRKHSLVFPCYVGKISHNDDEVVWPNPNQAFICENKLLTEAYAFSQSNTIKPVYKMVRNSLLDIDTYDVINLEKITDMIKKVISLENDNGLSYVLQRCLVNIQYFATKCKLLQNINVDKQLKEHIHNNIFEGEEEMGSDDQYKKLMFSATSKLFHTCWSSLVDTVQYNNYNLFELDDYLDLTKINIGNMVELDQDFSKEEVEIINSPVNGLFTDTDMVCHYINLAKDFNLREGTDMYLMIPYRVDQNKLMFAIFKARRYEDTNTILTDECVRSLYVLYTLANKNCCNLLLGTAFVLDRLTVADFLDRFGSATKYDRDIDELTEMEDQIDGYEEEGD